MGRETVEVCAYVTNCGQLLSHGFTLFDKGLFLGVFAFVVDRELCPQNVGPETIRSVNDLELSIRLKGQKKQNNHGVQSTPCKIIANKNH